MQKICHLSTIWHDVREMSLSFRSARIELSPDQNGYVLMDNPSGAGLHFNVQHQSISVGWVIEGIRYAASDFDLSF
jgi:hypothetical protein